ncbi:hypothetical protein MACH21_26630 [Roseicyclus marinus]|uniref:Uncharacterized protein n=1 Tax=Roseicyclus marinus TaxID=2161673 RepID=A0AA48HUS4_9RHOB|nr:hypothetical protein MACH21_26630 [Roseicyclus marinus]
MAADLTDRFGSIALIRCPKHHDGLIRHGNPAHSDNCITVTAETSRPKTSRFSTSGAKYAKRSCLLTWRSARFTGMAKSRTVLNSPASIRRRQAQARPIAPKAARK